jgi:hypothetical protein
MYIVSLPPPPAMDDVSFTQKAAEVDVVEQVP